MRQFLVVDDSPVIRKVARRMFEGLRFATAEAPDGPAGLQACADAMPDAILLDGTMPTMGGVEFLRRLRKMPGGAAPKVLFCALEYDVTEIARALRAGADDYVMKPFDREGMLVKLADAGII